MASPGKAVGLLIAFGIGVIVGIALDVGVVERDSPSPAPASPSDQAPDPIAPPAARSDPPTRPIETVPPVEDGVTAVRFLLIPPDDLGKPKLVAAWWRADPVNTMCLARLSGSVLTMKPPTGRGRIKFHIAGCVVVQRDVDLSEGVLTDAGEIRLVRCTPLRGMVVDASGAPVESAFLYPSVDEITVPLTSTGTDGAFEFNGLPDGRARLRIKCDGFVRQFAYHDHSPESEPPTIVLFRGGKVAGRVIDDAGAAVPDAYIWIVDAEDKKNRERMAWPSVEDDGTFVVHLAQGRYVLHGRDDAGKGSVNLEVKDGSDTAVTLELSP